MDWPVLLYLLPYLASFAISLGVGIYAWRRPAAIGAKAYAISAFGAAGWTLGFSLELLSPTIAGKVFWDNLQIATAFVVSVAWFVFALEYTGRKLTQRARVWGLLLIVPVLSMLVVFTDPWHHLVRSNIRLEPRLPAPEMLYRFAPAALTMAVYINALILASLLLLFTQLIGQHRLYRLQTSLIFTGIFIPFSGILFTLLGISLGPYRDTFPFTSGFGSWLAAWSLFRFRLFDLRPVAREAVVESMSDLVVVLDAHNRVVDANPAVLKLLHRPVADIIGQPTTQVFASWPSLAAQYQNITVTHAEVVADFPEGPRYFDLHLSPLGDQSGQLTGRLAVARDITAAKATQIALQQAHAELEQRVQARTAELSEVNAALRAEIAERQRIEDFVQRNEIKYRTLFESANDAIFLLQNTQFVDCNFRALRMFGCERQQIIGQSPMRFSPTHQPDGAPSQARLHEKVHLALAGTPQAFEWRHCRYTGNSFEAEVNLNRIDLENGPHLLMIVRDVTERQRAAAEKAQLLYDLNERVKELTALHATAQLLQHDQSTVAELLQQIVVLLPRAWQYPAITAARLTFAGVTAQTENFSLTPWQQQAEFTSSRGERGTLEIVYLAERPPAAEGPFLAEERTLINSLAKMLHAHFERQQAEKALRESEKRLRLMIEHMPVMVDAVDLEGHIGLWNHECERVTGYTAAEIIGNPQALELLYPNPAYREQMLSEWQTRGNNYRNWAWQLTAKDGSTRIIEWSNISEQIPLLNWQTWGVGIDVTERRRAEEAEQRYAARMEILHQIDRAILAAHLPEETALAALTRIRQLVPCHHANVVLFDFQAQLASVLTVNANGHTHVSPGQSIPLATFGAAPLQSLQRGQTVMVEDVQAQPDFPESGSLFIVQTLRAWLTLPLLFQGVLIGALSLGREQPGPFGTEDVEIVREVADQLSIAIQQARLFAATERRMRELTSLHEIAQTFNNLTDVRETYGVLAERIARLIGAERCFVMLREADGWDRAQAPGYGVTDAELQILCWPAHDFDTLPLLQTYRERGSAFTNSLQALPTFLQDLAQAVTVQNVLIGLLRYEKMVIGHVVVVNRAGGVSADDAQLLGVCAAQAAVVIQNARLYALERLAHEQTNTLLEVAHTVSSTLSLHEVLLRILQESARVLPFVSGSITVYENGSPTLMALTGHEGREAIVMQATYSSLKDSPILKRLQSQQRPLNISDVRQDADWLQYPETTYIRSWLGVPLSAQGQMIGVLSLDSDQPFAFTPQHLNAAEAFAAQAAIAIVNARLFAAEHAAREQAEVLQAASAVVAHSLNLDVVLAALLDQMHRLVPYDSATVFLVEDSSRATVWATRGYEHWPNAVPNALGTIFEISTAPGLHQLVTTQQSLLVSDTTESADWVLDLVGSHVRGWIGIPLIAEGRVLGLYSLDKTVPQFFTEAHVRFAEVLSAQGAIAIQHAQLFAQVQAGRGQLQALSRQLVQVQEEERHHLARELHDEVGQILTGLKLLLGVVPRLPPEKVNDQINEALTILSHLTERVHDLSLDLRPMMLDDLGLMAALLWLFDRFTAQTGVRVNFEAVGLAGRLPPTVETTAYRLIQEALTNVARYAETQEAQVRLLVAEAQLRLQVQDTGRGFDVATVLATGQRVGLTGMKERAALLGGWLHIESSPQAGTQITATLPL